MTQDTSQVVSLGPSSVFAYFRQPGDKNCYLFHELREGRAEPQGIEDTGFILQPFSEEPETPGIFIWADQIFVDPLLQFEAPDMQMPDSTKKEEYAELAEKFIFATKSDLQKAVLSRILKVESCGTNILSVFQRLCERHPDAFIYLLNHPLAGCWMGASPETLLDVGNGMCRTMALAATMSVEDRRKGNDWRQKEMLEQDLVSQFIIRVLESEGIRYEKIGPFDSQAGSVIHLRTDFSFPAVADPLRLVRLLHPTPAVCGLPRDAAKDFIQSEEPHDRRYYTGFLGPCAFMGRTKLFVNLRCMQISRKHYLLYLGGGIVPASIPEEEWQETSNKARTLLDAIGDNE